MCCCSITVEGTSLSAPGLIFRMEKRMIVLNWITVSVFLLFALKNGNRSPKDQLWPLTDQSLEVSAKDFFFKSICWPQLQNDSIITRKHEKSMKKHEKNNKKKHKKIRSWSHYRDLIQLQLTEVNALPKARSVPDMFWHLIGYGLKVWNKTAVWTFTWISEMRCLLCDLQPIDPDPFLNLSMFVPCRPEMVEHCAKRPCKFVSMSGLPHGLWDPRWILRNYPATPSFLRGEFEQANIKMRGLGGFCCCAPGVGMR